MQKRRRRGRVYTKFLKPFRKISRNFICVMWWKLAKYITEFRRNFVWQNIITRNSVSRNFVSTLGRGPLWAEPHESVQATRKCYGNYCRGLYLLFPPYQLQCPDPQSLKAMVTLRFNIVAIVAIPMLGDVVAQWLRPLGNQTETQQYRVRSRLSPKVAWWAAGTMTVEIYCIINKNLRRRAVYY
jgi:hypothetical protein